MSKTETKPQYTRKQIAVVMLPWAIIVLVIIAFTGAVAGWTMRGVQSEQVNTEAANMVSSLSKPSK